jgi:hypothetical protein
MEESMVILGIGMGLTGVGVDITMIVDLATRKIKNLIHVM